jgi:hypothetical protein
MDVVVACATCRVLRLRWAILHYSGNDFTPI